MRIFFFYFCLFVINILLLLLLPLPPLTYAYRELEHFKGLSFPTISSTGANAGSHSQSSLL